LNYARMDLIIIAMAFWAVKNNEMW